MIQIRQDASLNKDFFEAALVDELMDQHLLQGELLRLSLGPLDVFLLQVSILELDLEDSPVGTIANFVANRKVTSRQRPNSIYSSTLAVARGQLVCGASGFGRLLGRVGGDLVQTI